jgi:hypothetical protein
MSLLEALNSPPLIGILTAGCYGIVANKNNPLFLLSTRVPWSTIKGMNVLSYGISLYSVTRPGRYDSQQTQASSSSSSSELKKKNDDAVIVDNDNDNNDNDNDNDDDDNGINDGSDRSLLNPAGWAFSIWGVIFIGELIMVSAPYISSSSPPTAELESIIRNITGPYMMSQLFQSLWCASFRPKYNYYGRSSTYYYYYYYYAKYLSVLNLSGIALSLSFCHDAFTKSSPSYSNMDYWLYFLPLSLHFGWTTAASLVNLNGMYALRSSSDNDNNDNNKNNNNNDSNDNDSITKAKSVALLGNVSVFIASAIGITLTYMRNAPVYGGVIAWALSAVSFGLKKRILLLDNNNANANANANDNANSEKSKSSSLLSSNNNNNNNNDNKVGIYGAKTQQTLCQIGAISCAITSTIVAAFGGRGGGMRK